MTAAEIVIGVAGLIVVFAVPAAGWVFRRVTRASQADAADQTRVQIKELGEDLKRHVDGTTDELRRWVGKVDERTIQTREELAALASRVDTLHPNTRREA